VDGADTEAFFLAWEGGLPSADINNDGAVDIADIAAFDDIWEAGETPQAGLCMLTAIRVGYAGYQWDGSVNNDRTVSGAMAGLYHVRYRVYDPELGRWTRRDPLGYVDGMGLYEMASGRVVVKTDPDGLRVAPAPPAPCGSRNSVRPDKIVCMKFQSIIDSYCKIMKQLCRGCGGTGAGDVPDKSGVVACKELNEKWNNLSQLMWEDGVCCYYYYPDLSSRSVKCCD
jgi:RHS repeat-associated protein